MKKQQPEKSNRQEKSQKYNRDNAKQGVSRSTVGSMLLGAALLAMGYLGWSAFGGSAGVVASADLVTSDLAAARLSQFNQVSSLNLSPVTEIETYKAFSILKLNKSQVSALEADIKSGNTELAWITLWDDMSEDGDIVEIKGGSMVITVALTNAKQTFPIIINQGAVTLTGIADGGGGITTSAATTSGILPLPVIAAGQTITIPVK